MTGDDRVSELTGSTAARTSSGNGAGSSSGTRADLSVRGLSWRPYGRVRSTLSVVDLEVRAGERVLLVGASGSGKSTLLQALAGLLDDSLGERAGEVRLGDGPPGRRPGQVGLMLQDPTHTVVAEYAGRDAAFGPENAAQPPAVVRDRAAAALAAVRFPYGADHRSTELSGGQLQRLSLAGTLALDPDLLLLDEPTAMLDSAAAARVRTAVRAVVGERRLTLVVVEHRLDGWLEVCDRMVVLGEGGEVVADGPTQEVLRHHRSELDRAGVWVPGEPAPQPAAVDWLEPALDTSLDPADAPALRPAVAGDRAAPALALKDVSVAAPTGTSGSPASRGVRPLLIADLDLELAPGESLAVTGPSGSGKSTLLRTVAGFHPPVAGAVLLGDHPVAGLSKDPKALAAAVAWLPQHVDQLITARTVGDEVLATSLRLHADQPDRLTEDRSRAQRVLEALGLWELRDAEPHQLSVGEQRRLGLAAVVVHGPRLLLLDEPTVGQDRQTWAAVLGVVRALQREGCAVLASTHDLALADALERAHALTPGEQSLTEGEQSLTPGGQSLAEGEQSLDAEGEPGQDEIGDEVSADYRVTEVFEPGAPPVARCNPLALLIVALGAAIGSFFIRDWPVGALSLGLVALLAPLAVRAPRSVLLRLVPVGLAALTVGWSTLVFSDCGAFAASAWPVAAREVLRIAYLVVPGVLLVPSLAPSRLSDALTQRARLPHRPVVVAAAALLRVQQLLDTWRQLSEIRAIRALNPGRSAVLRVRNAASMTFSLLVWSLRSSQQMALSMDARGFASARHRTNALPSAWRAPDWLCLGVAIGLALFPALLTALMR